MGALTDPTPVTIEDNICSEEISEKVITAVAEAKGVDPLELDPLYDVVDPDALNSLFRPSHRSSSAAIELRFSMSGCQVVIQQEGDVTVISPTENQEEGSIDSLDDWAFAWEHHDTRGPASTMARNGQQERHLNSWILISRALRRVRYLMEVLRLRRRRAAIRATKPVSAVAR